MRALRFLAFETVRQYLSDKYLHQSTALFIAQIKFNVPETQQLFNDLVGEHCKKTAIRTNKLHYGNNKPTDRQSGWEQAPRVS